MQNGFEVSSEAFPCDGIDAPHCTLGVRGCEPDERSIRVILARRLLPAGEKNAVRKLPKLHETALLIKVSALLFFR